MGTTAEVDLLGVRLSNPQLDISSIAQDRRFLNSIVMLPSIIRGYLWGLATTMVETSMGWCGSFTGGGRISIPK